MKEKGKDEKYGRKFKEERKKGRRNKGGIVTERVMTMTTTIKDRK